MRAWLVALLVGCGPMAPRDMTPSPPPAYCSSASGVWAQDCNSHCLPAEPAFVVCTQNFGRVFYTRSGLRTRRAYGATQEIHDMRCSSSPYRVWALTPFTPTDAAAGLETLAYGSECSTSPVSGFFMQTDKLYYTAVEVTAPSPQ